MSSHQLTFTDTSFTDGQAAVWAGGLDTPMLLAPAAALSVSGLAAVEVLGPAVVDTCLARGEHPLQRVEVAGRHYGGVPLRATVNLLTGHGRRGADVLGRTTIGGWLSALAAAGVAQVVLLDPLLDLPRLEGALESAATAGLTAIAALPYTADDGVADETYAERAAWLAAAGAARVMVRDESGVLTPSRAHTLLPALAAALGSTPLDLHTRCHTALGTVVALEAGRLGVSGIDTALPAVANGASLPSLPSLIRVLQREQPGLDLPVLDKLLAADAILADIADQEGFAAAAAWPFDLATYVHQLPGEVAAEVRGVVRERGRWAELHEFATECAAVRREMGSPPMVAPFARAIAEQALCHFDGEARYESLRPVLRRLLQGVYGTPDGEARSDLQLRVGALPSSESTTVAADFETGDEDALLAWVAGVTIATVPRRVEVAPYESSTPYERLAHGVAERAGRYAMLSVHAPGVHIHLQQEG
ncbi:hypothetical protein [Nocardia sp. NPDC004604]|uniref:hypothetical protein n=1 Tax=Nocardia sp. NPDC004604 TaxID=3157013 RepID=UPI0033B7D390